MWYDKTSVKACQLLGLNCPSTGGDGGFSFWDKDNKQRLKEVTERGGPIVAAAFNKTSNIFAYGISYDWGQGHQGNTGQIPNRVKLHAVKVGDLRSHRHNNALRLKMHLFIIYPLSSSCRKKMYRKRTELRNNRITVLALSCRLRIICCVCSA